MIKSLIIVLTLLLCTSSFSINMPFFSKNKDKAFDTTSIKKEKPKNANFIRAERYKDDILHRGRDIIFGEGIYPIGNDIGAAKIEAKKRAKSDLSQKIKVKVSSDISTILKVNKKRVLQDDFNEQINIYTEQVLEDVTEADFIDFPKDGNITAFAYISRKKYEEKVAKELSQTKARIRDFVVSGDKQFNSGIFMVALQNWLDALDYFSMAFQKNLPVRDDLNGDGKDEDISSYIKGQINDFYGRLSIGFIASELSYDANGKLNKDPEVTVHYLNKDGNKKAVANIPLKIKFEKGSGRVGKNLVTGTYGMSTITFDTLVANTQSISITVNIDKDKIKGLEKFILPPIAPLTFTMKKIRTVGVYVVFSNLGKVSIPNDIINISNNVLNDCGYSATPLSLTGTSFNRTNSKIALEHNVDYVLIISFKSTGGDSYGGLDMYVANCSGEIKFYSVKQGIPLNSINLPAKRGVSVKRSSAGYKAFSKAKVGFEKRLKNMVEKIR